jgi:hypothetical protein
MEMSAQYWIHIWSLRTWINSNLMLFTPYYTEDLLFIGDII